MMKKMSEENVNSCTYIVLGVVLGLMNSIFVLAYGYGLLNDILSRMKRILNELKIFKRKS